MLRRKRTKRTLILTGALGAGALLAIGVALWPGPSAAPPVTAAEVPGGVAPQPEPPAAAPAIGETRDAAVEPATADLPVVCAALEEDQRSPPTRECMAALEARFLPRPASRAILPVSPPLVWSDVFQGTAAKIEAVDAALADAACDVPEGGIRPELGGRCAARAMAALHVLRQVCSMDGMRGVDPHFSLSPKGFDLGALDLAVWDRVDRVFYRTNVDAEGRGRALERWSERAPDQEAWAAGKRRLDDLYHRTAWKRARCRASTPTLEWMGGERWEGLLARAARLGDAFALAHHLGDAAHAAKLAEIDAPQGHLHLASLELRNIRDAWREEDSEAGWSVFKEHLDDRIRLLRLAGIDCGDCAMEDVNKAFHTYRYHFRQCAKVKCANLEAMRELDAALGRPYEALSSTRSTRSLPHRRRAEAVALKYALAVEALARAAGVEVDSNLLRHLADADAPTLLTAEEVEQVRGEAARLVAAVGSPA